MSKNAIVMVGTDRYLLLALRFISKIRLAYKDKKHPIIIHLFSDKDPGLTIQNLIFHKIETMDWTMSTLYRFEAIQKVIKFKYDNILYIDADTNLNKNSELYFDDIFSSNLFATEHHDKVTNHYEENDQSYAFINPKERGTYFQAFLYGGSSEMISKLVDDATNRLKKDLENNFIARAEDESYIQPFLNANKADFSSFSNKIIAGDKGLGEDKLMIWGKRLDLKTEWPDTEYNQMLMQAIDFSNRSIDWDIHNKTIICL